MGHFHKCATSALKACTWLWFAKDLGTLCLATHVYLRHAGETDPPTNTQARKRHIYGSGTFSVARGLFEFVSTRFAQSLRSVAEYCGASDLCLKTMHKFCGVLRKITKNKNGKISKSAKMQNKKRKHPHFFWLAKFPSTDHGKIAHK